jgi:hypothetical protein
MSGAVDREKIKLYMSIPGIAMQDIPVLNTSPVYVFFEKRKAAAQNYLEYESSQAQELQADIIQMCNESIRRYLGLI